MGALWQPSRVGLGGWWDGASRRKGTYVCLMADSWWCVVETNVEYCVLQLKNEKGQVQLLPILSFAPSTLFLLRQQIQGLEVASASWWPGGTSRGTKAWKARKEPDRRKNVSSCQQSWVAVAISGCPPLSVEKNKTVMDTRWVLDDQLRIQMKRQCFGPRSVTY